ncbi:lipid kinase, YegS/Rv2252/BmrU family [Caloramator quimbayensis]|uniref:Lipid kinase, YegS/Rv2252/BmrU family n=1 Tax=Caloramator quimbayensis TaxID=1147123 RepID=A0A1T4X7G7_9CLOT|nr:YegS/Rv2252/BmrU family lipid kinase [Caloramator quimbayensis]SKA85389.1 lipid kinase, YegS/Rv2252/BmrU family [Caloramator quimbayensis]
MKKARLIYNPYSGDRSFRMRLDLVIDKLQRGGYEVIPHRTMSVEDIYLSISNSDYCDCIIVSGGDGTINHVINAMLQKDLDVPIGIIPSGTSNDFAAHLNIPKRVSHACDIISNGNILEIDVGKINERYFVNVAAGGLLTDVSQKIDINLKNTLGKMAYYIKGIEQLPNFRAIPITIEHEDNIINEMVYLFVILNGSTAGGFKLAPDATAHDGKLNLIAVKSCNLMELFNLFIKMLKGEHLESSNIIYLKGEKFSIKCNENIETDIDGETGPLFPLNVSISNKKLKVFTPINHI